MQKMGFREHGDETSGSGATELFNTGTMKYIITTVYI
jgi:hypothetical protein